VLAIGGIVLASGLSKRFGSRNKLLMPVGGVAIVRRTVEAYLGAGLDPVVVVIGNDSQAVGAALSGLSVIRVENPDFREGQSRALVRGVRALPVAISAAIIGVADQPFLTPTVIERLATSYREFRAHVVAPRYDGRRGNPVLFDRSLFPELMMVEGDQGGRGVLDQHQKEIVWVDVPDAHAGIDVNTEEDYRKLVAE
jgi:molybdenum cofactor cytidylyltransferase